ncbi:MAG: M28 family metallopeptidase [Acidobacteriota bacterium]|jgi:Zn-dependent M28 family amino/carboxypeptidase
MRLTHRATRSHLLLSSCLLLVGILTACGGGEPAAPPTDTTAPAPRANGINADDLATYTRELADDALAGRGPGGPGEVPTLEYLQRAYERIGLQPVGDASLPGAAPGSPQYFQQVELTAITADPQTAYLSFVGTPEAAELQLSYADDFVTWTKTPDDVIDVAGGLVFVGYGVDAPEESWNDYDDMDVTGKILLMLVNDPPLEDASRFGGDAMTYYGRWTYKFEEGARKGAAGVLLIHDTDAAGYGWNVIQGWTGEQMGVPPAADSTPPVPLQGWVSWESAAAILAAAGQNLDELAAAAATDGFTPVDTGLIAAGHLDNTIRSVSSYNVVGSFAGSDPEVADEYVVFTAHWDHFGIGEPVDGDDIYNGAFDNATGTAALLEIAEGWVNAAPRRSGLFIATTAEESGLLGSTYYVEHPIVPLEKTLAEINIDGMNVWGPTTDLTIVGYGASTLDDDLTAVLAEQGRTPIPDPEPEKGFYYRSDHFPFARAGVPALYVDYGVTFVGKPEDFGIQVREDYNANRYHQPSDEFDSTWDFSGAAQDLDALLQVALRVGNGDTWPEWREGNEFKATRDRMLGR